MNAYDDNAMKPLFGIPKPSDRMRNLVIGIITAIFVLETLICAFVFPCWPPNNHDGVNIFFAFIIMMVCGSHITLEIKLHQEKQIVLWSEEILHFHFTVAMLEHCF
ncbi:transmembrane protein 243 isoform X2 [Octopus bimaculoides]|uniref:transmembrane protein 243 isoform X2 n=1 Tax=Octopus bimaculoides TaxID=37653 RepID=UPI0022E89079|nr:transmembrane protein 243 isoform X2 [Octopus bimaculoides]